MAAELASGILRRERDGWALFNAVQPAAGRCSVSPKLVQAFALVEGASITGPVREGRQGRELADVASVCGATPDAYRSRTPFEKLVAVDPSERFHLGAAGD